MSSARIGPLTWFGIVAVGALVWQAFARAPQAPNVVVLGSGQLESAVAQHAARTGRAPDASERARIRESLIDEELQVREAVALGLHADDPIIRRRLVQKLTYVAEMRAQAVDPSPADLDAFIAERPGVYAATAMTTLEHRFSAGEPPTCARAGGWVEALSSGQPVASDPSPFGAVLRGQTRARIEAQFGSDFADAVGRAPLNNWFVAASRLGCHAVRVLSRVEADAEMAEASRRRAERDWRARRAERGLAQWRRELRDRYEVVWTEEQP